MVFLNLGLAYCFISLVMFRILPDTGGFLLNPNTLKTADIHVGHSQCTSFSELIIKESETNPYLVTDLAYSQRKIV